MADVAGWAVLHALWQGGLLWLFLELAQRRLGRSSAVARIRIAEATLILAVAVSSVTVWSVAARLGAWNGPLDPGSVAAPIVETVDPDGGAPAQSLLAILSGDSWTRVVEETGVSRSLRTVSPWVGLVWLLGVAWWAARFIRASRWLVAVRDSNHGAPEAVMVQRSSQLAERIGLRRAVVIVESDLVDSPVVAGPLCPTIVLPRDFNAYLSQEQFDAALLHELMHVRRGDQVRIVLYAIVRALYFFHPLLKSIINRLEFECEIACDGSAADALGSRRTYASALVRFHELRRPREDPLLISRLRGPSGELRTRIHSLLGTPAEKPRWQPVVRNFLFSLAVFAVVAGTPLASEARDIARGEEESGSRLWVTTVGQYDLDPRRVDSISLEAGGSFIVEERSPEATLRLDLTGRLAEPPAYAFYRSGTPALFDEDARSWLEGVLSREVVAAAVFPGPSADRRLGIDGRIQVANGDAVSIVMVGSRDEQASASHVILDLVTGMVEQRARGASRMDGDDSEFQEVVDHLVSHGLLSPDEASAYWTTN